jgi:hypothetical protein
LSKAIKMSPGKAADVDGVRPRRLTGLRMAGIGCAVVFVALMGARMGFWTADTPEAHWTANGPPAQQDVWMNILQSGRKIGYTHRMLTPTDAGFALRDAIQMKINTMGLTQTVVTETIAELGPEMALQRFRFKLRSGRFSFHASGVVADKVLTVDQRGQSLSIPLNGDIFLSSGILPQLARRELAVEQSVAFPVFDPSTMAQKTVTVVFEGDETIDIDGTAHPARRFSVDFMGAQQYAWLAADGQVLRESGLLGLTLERVPKKVAMTFHGDEPVADLTRLASVPVNKPLTKPEELRSLTLRAKGIDGLSAVDGGRQVLRGDTIVISKESLPVEDTGATKTAEYLEPSAMVPSDHPLIRQAVRDILSGAASDSDIEKARRLVMWVFANIEKTPVISVPNALEVLEKRQGDCNEHAVLLAALARAAGIPAAIETGLVYLDGRFYYHAWNRLHIGVWVTADALMNQFPADVTHLRLSAGESADQLDLLSVIGRIELEIVEAI